MRYSAQTCVECNEAVLTANGRMVAHNIRGTSYPCEGTGELSLEAEQGLDGLEEKTETVKKEKPAPPTQAAKSPAARFSSPQVPDLKVEAVKREFEVAQTRARSNISQGSLDLEKLKNCGCPSLANAIRRYLGE